MTAEVKEKLESGEWGKEACMARAVAAMRKPRHAARFYEKAGLRQCTLDMYSDLRMFDIKREFIAPGNSQNRTVLFRRREEWAKSFGEPRATAEMFLAAGDVQRAIHLVAEYGWNDRLIIVGRQLHKAERGSHDNCKKIEDIWSDRNFQQTWK